MPTLLRLTRCCRYSIRPKNRHGLIAKICISTKVINYAHTLKDTKYLHDLTIPDHITSKIQFHYRIIRTHSMDYLTERKVRIYMYVFYIKGGPTTRQIEILEQKFGEFKHIYALWVSLRNLAEDKEMYKSTQTKKLYLSDIELETSQYYGDGYASEYQNKLITMIRQLFNA